MCRLVLLNLLVEFLNILGRRDCRDELLKANFEVIDVGDGEEDKVLKALAESQTATIQTSIA